MQHYKWYTQDMQHNKSTHKVFNNIRVHTRYATIEKYTQDMQHYKWYTQDMLRNESTHKVFNNIRVHTRYATI